MKRYASVMSFVLFALCGQGTPAREAAATPTQPQAASGHAVLAKARAAMGGTAWEHARSLRAEGRLESSGLQGPWSRIEDLSRGRFAIAADLGVFRVAEGDDGRTHWRQDPSGAVHALNAPFAKSAAITEAWLTRRAWLRPGAEQARIGAAVARTEQDRHYLVIEATPRSGQALGQALELWFDATTHLLDRTVRTMPISVQTVRYRDYRAVAGLRVPFTIESHDAASDSVETMRVDRWSLVKQLESAAFAAPTPPDDTTLDGETTVPMELSGFPTVEARLNGRSFHFILDTGGHNILTPAAAEALGVRPVGAGSSGGAGSGQLAQQYVRIDKLEIGAATMRDQHFYVLPLQYGTVERGTREPLAGLLGLELFERFAMRMDYPAKTLTLRKLAGFRYQGKGTAVPISFDDDMPLIEGRINGIPGLIALDTGNSGTTVVQQVWARRHGLAERLKRGVETVSFGAGGASTNWASRIDSLEIGGVVLPKPYARYAEDSAGAFSSRTEAANIGTDALANFVLDIDYARGVIWFEHRPGYVSLPFNRSGLRAVKDEPGAFRVAVVSVGSPAAAAGLMRGDLIVAVDGVAAARMSGHELRDKLIQPVGTQLSLTVRRADDQREVKLTLAEMLP